LPKLEKKEKGQKEKSGIIDLLKRLQSHLDENQPVRTFQRSEEEDLLLKPYPFLTAKKELFVANVAEDALPSMSNAHVKKVEEYAKKHGAHVIAICAKLEAEVAGLGEEDSLAYLQEVGLKETGLDRLIKTSFQELGLLTFLTTGEIETRAWTIPQGTKAPLAAGKIHTDIQKGFIRAEVVSYDDLIHYQGRPKAKEAGKVRMEGKEYIVKDGDVILFYHN
jgi:GTP-binding protein YchF